MQQLHFVDPRDADYNTASIFYCMLLLWDSVNAQIVHSKINPTPSCHSVHDRV